MYSIEVSIVNSDSTSSGAFESAATSFVEELGSVPDLQVTTQTKRVEGTRGVITLLTGIIVVGIKIGAFSAIYALAKDLYARYVNAEVQLKFKDGSVLTLKNLTQKEAEEKIANHLKKLEAGD